MAGGNRHSVLNIQQACDTSVSEGVSDKDEA